MNTRFPYILIASLLLAIFFGFIKYMEKDGHHKWQLRNATRLSYHAGFARAANTLKDQKGCALYTVPDVDSLFIIDVKTD